MTGRVTSGRGNRIPWTNTGLSIYGSARPMNHLLIPGLSACTTCPFPPETVPGNDLVPTSFGMSEGPRGGTRGNGRKVGPGRVPECSASGNSGSIKKAWSRDYVDTWDILSAVIWLAGILWLAVFIYLCFPFCRYCGKWIVFFDSATICPRCRASDDFRKYFLK